VKVAHLLRKPLSEGSVAANVLKHGTGAINVDGCRVGHAEECRMMAPSQANIDNPSKKYRQAGRREAVLELKPEGRWPANLVLIHKPGCRAVGTRIVPGYAINRWVDGAKPFGGGAGHEYATTQTEASTEIVWDCEPDCGVKEINRQTGDSDEDGSSRFFKQFAPGSSKKSA
jgi:hypothetical protein